MEAIQLVVLHDAKEFEEILLTFLGDDIVTIVRKNNNLKIILDKNKVKAVKEKLGMGQSMGNFFFKTRMKSQDTVLSRTNFCFPTLTL